MSRRNPAGDWVVPPVNSYALIRNGGRFEALAKRVEGISSESAQVNAVVHTLAGMGHKNADKPDVYNASVDRSTYRVYVWRSTPFGDAVVLGTGPAFVPSLALGAQVPAEPGVGVFVQAALADKIPPTLAGAQRAAGRGERATARISAREAAGEHRATAKRAAAAAREEAARAAAEAARAAAEREAAAAARAAARKPRAPRKPKAPAVPEFYRAGLTSTIPARSRMRAVEGGEFVSLAEERRRQESRASAASAKSEKEELMAGLAALIAAGKKGGK